MQNRRPTVNVVWFVVAPVLAVLILGSSSQVSSADVTRRALKFDFGSGVAASLTQLLRAVMPGVTIK